MIKKYLKIFMGLIIFCGYIFYSYASLSASDGSAFVSRKEFEESIKDFSGRLNTFEVGLNSKIDSQVRSYLDRNGIWSGVKQQLASETDIRVIGVLAPSGLSRNVTSSYNLVNNKMYIPKITKNGMLVGTWMWKCNSTINNNDTRWGYNGNVSSSATSRADSGFYVILKMDEYTEENVYLDNPYSTVLMSAIGDTNGDKSSNTSYNVNANLSTKEIVTPFKFFVSKNSAIKWSVIMYYRFYNVTSISVRNYENSRFSIYLQDAVVY